MALIFREKINPIIVREMRSRMRGARAFITLALSAFLLSLLAILIYTSIFYQSIDRTYSPYAAVTRVDLSPTIGTAIFTGNFLLLLAIVTFVAPAFGAAALAGEHERQTYETLLITLLKPRQIVWGKMGAIFGLLLLFLLVSLPIQSIAFTFGGVTPAEGIIGTLGLLITALMLSAVGLYISSRARTTVIAVMISYGVTIPFIYGLPLLLLFLFEGPFYWIRDRMYETTLLAKIVLFYGIGFILSISPFSSTILSYYYIVEQQEGYFFFSITEQVTTPLAANGQTAAVTFWLVSPWLVYVIFHTLLALVLIQLTIRRVARMSDK